MSKANFIGTLPPGSLDIVGDVHGEAAALAALLAHLGYRHDGSHPEGRHLVFVGDLCDRGPDSPRVLARVRHLVEQGLASAVLGNHELNLLIGERKDGNDWFWNEGNPKDRRYHPWSSLPGRGPHPERTSLLSFLAGLPLALERADVRVVHAAWHAPSVAVLRHLPGHVGLCKQYDALETLARRYLQADGLADRYAAEHELWSEYLGDAYHPMPALAAHAQAEERRQMAHPMRVLTSGVEKATGTPFFAAGRWRFTQRQPWWRHYDESVPVVMGHYWRRLLPGPGQSVGRRERDPFLGIDPHAWMGRRGNVFCVDFSVGARYHERKPSPGGALLQPTALAALRWPERELVTDDGRCTSTHSFGVHAASARPAGVRGMVAALMPHQVKISRR